MLDGRRVEIVETRVLPGVSRHGIQWARLYLSGDSLVGLSAVFVQQSFLYQEVTRSQLLLNPGGNAWVPARVHIESTVGLPFSRSRSYSLDVRYHLPPTSS